MKTTKVYTHGRVGIDGKHSADIVSNLVKTIQSCGDIEDYVKPDASDEQPDGKVSKENPSRAPLPSSADQQKRS
jgi:hypothetical protein